jgi:hypothetical protein
VDVALVLSFAAVGRASHVKGVTVLGVVDTAWPFLMGLFLGWVAARLLWRDWPRGVVHAVPVWLLTVSAGLVLRVVSGGGGAPLSFTLVATVVLGTFLLGWRGLARLRGLADWRGSRQAVPQASGDQPGGANT